MKIKKQFIVLILFLNSGNIIAQNFDKTGSVELTIMDKTQNYTEPRSPYYWHLNRIQPLQFSPNQFYSPAKLPPLKDTLKTELNSIDYIREYDERVNEKGDVDISFNLYSNADYSKEYYIFYDSKRINYDAKTEFTADWFLLFGKKPEYAEPEVSQLSIYLMNDTIYTITDTYPDGGTTPEGHSFRISGGDVLKVSVKSKAVFSVDQIYFWSIREEWTKNLYLLETPWIDSSNGVNSYRLPILRNVRLNKDTFALIKKKSIEAQKELLIEKRDSILAARKLEDQLSYIYTKEILDDFKKRLKSNFEDANTPDELYVRFELQYFITELTVHYKDGTSGKIYHFAQYQVSVL